MIELCSLEDLTPGEIVRFADRDDLEVPIAVVLIDGQVFAIDDTCSHEDMSLADGALEGHCILCPLHASRFDVRTGEPDAPPATRPVRRHEVSVDAGVVYIRLATSLAS